ncbi:MAG: hypothetical protein SFV15_07900 [Polyangiaceae bacterium]|nr:hypothetical protein [Polyangiaceae bacterium]
MISRLHRHIAAGLLGASLLVACNMESESDLTSDGRVQPFEVLRLQREKLVMASVPITEEVFLLRGSNGFYQVVDTTAATSKPKCLSEFSDRDCILVFLKEAKHLNRRSELIGFSKLSNFAGPQFEGGPIDWYLVTIKSHTYSYRVAWLDRVKQTVSMRDFDSEKILRLFAQDLCEAGLAHGAEPCRRTVKRYLRLHYGARVDVSTLHFSSDEGLTALVKEVLATRRLPVADALSSAPSTSDDWSFRLQ